MVDFIISPSKRERLKKKMHRLSIRESDLVERFVRSRGRGGQNVNKVSTCCYLKHKPTKIVVKCDRERSQAMNRFLARSLLAEKIETAIRKEKAKAKHRIEKIRRQRRKRPQWLKEKMLEGKKKRSEKKSRRKKVEHEE